MHTLAIVVVVATLGTIGCAMAATPTTSPATAPARDGRYAIALADGKASWSARVNTGGWSMTTDRVAVEGGVAKLYVTLASPAPGAMVAQAFMTLTGESAVDVAATSAELHVRRDAAATYERVATTP